MRSEYEIVACRLGALWIADRNRGGLSVTNDAERVCAELHARYGEVRIYYRDSMGRWDELRHQRGVFVAFAPGAPALPAY